MLGERPMAEKTVRIKVFRFDPETDAASRYQEYEVPLVQDMSAMDALDYIYQHLDSTLAYYDHAACSLGICARCSGRINGKPGLFCQSPITGDATLDPLSPGKVIKDLVFQ
jgi:succinate dehydrogenase/fumarate reductase-like Fe-S protein